MNHLNNPPGDYILHSVLVHAGDYGGGHYYAYIRPSAGFDYAAQARKLAARRKELFRQLETRFGKSYEEMNTKEQTQMNDTIYMSMKVAGHGGVWYKFDDEHVFEVDEEEAIEFNFGRGQLNGGFSSAYMLIYVRADTTSYIMKPCSSESGADIPSDLVQRLQLMKESCTNYTEKSLICRKRRLHLCLYFLM